MRWLDEKRQALVDALDEETVGKLDYLLIRFRPPSDHFIADLTRDFGGAGMPGGTLEYLAGMTSRQARLLSEYLAAAAEEAEGEGQVGRLETLAKLSAVLGRAKALSEESGPT